MNKHNNRDLELYKQHLDTHRHLDKLRWQMFQLAILLSSLVIGIRGYSLPDVKEAEGTWIGTSILFSILGLVKLNLCREIFENSIALKYYGKKVGDTWNTDGMNDIFSTGIGIVLVFIGWVMLQIIRVKAK